MLVTLIPAYMKLLTFLSLLVNLFSFSTKQSIKSNLYIPAGEQFNLGGSQNYDYRIEAKNAGLAQVDLFLNNKTELIPLGELSKKESFEAIVPSGQSLIIRNNSPIKAHIKVHVKGKSSNLAMFYTEAAQN